MSLCCGGIRDALKADESTTSKPVPQAGRRAGGSRAGIFMGQLTFYFNIKNTSESTKNLGEASI